MSKWRDFSRRLSTEAKQHGARIASIENWGTNE